MRARRSKDTRRRAPQRTGEREREGAGFGSSICMFLSPWACPMYVGPARSGVCFTWGPHSGPRTFFCFIFTGFSLPCLWPPPFWTFSLFYLPNTNYIRKDKESFWMSTNQNSIKQGKLVISILHVSSLHSEGRVGRRRLGTGLSSSAAASTTFVLDLASTSLHLFLLIHLFVFFLWILRYFSLCLSDHWLNVQHALSLLDCYIWKSYFLVCRNFFVCAPTTSFRDPFFSFWSPLLSVLLVLIYTFT